MLQQRFNGMKKKTSEAFTQVTVLAQIKLDESDQKHCEVAA